jgi:hypothetical protein
MTVSNSIRCPLCRREHITKQQEDFGNPEDIEQLLDYSGFLDPTNLCTGCSTANLVHDTEYGILVCTSCGTIARSVYTRS